jgi:GNAT superfamily N-acetyltransferase
MSDPNQIFAGHIREARPDEAGRLSELARRSKASWGYDEDFMSRASEELTIPMDAIHAHQVWVLQKESGAILGFLRVIPGDPAILEDLWVEPAAMGAGHGRRLWEHAAAVARSGGASAMELDADPNALGFYERMGAVRVGVTPSTVVAGRELPRMRVPLRGAAPSDEARRLS